MKKLKFMAITLVTSIFTLSALINAASACMCGHHEPKLPNSLKK